MVLLFLGFAGSGGRRVPNVAGEGPEGIAQGLLWLWMSSNGTTTPEDAMKAFCFSMEIVMMWLPAGALSPRGNSIM